ncbi:MAG: hypothetical protein IT578_10295 [Verrucomicrobiae bacterium]|nr:hypothetical protein [Verrucomicrobiae bacterium]
MEKASTLLSHLFRLRLRRLGADASAGLWFVSLPWPRAKMRPLALDGRTSWQQPLGQWPDAPDGCPRRLLLAGDAGGDAPTELRLTRTAPGRPRTLPEVSMEFFERSSHPTEYLWERHFLRLRLGKRSVGLALGLRTGMRVHWWEACRLIEVTRTAAGVMFEMGGCIPLEQMTLEQMRSYKGLTNPFLHKHNWLNGRLDVRAYANGVCEVFAHHINSKFFDDGRDLRDAVPVIGLRVDATTAAEAQGLCGLQDGTRHAFSLAGVTFDIREAARLATPQRPGVLERVGDFLVWQPYEGMELYGGTCPMQILGGQPFVFKPGERIIPRGMARTIRFSFNLAGGSARVVRYQAPAWWYGVCEEFSPAPLLPVVNEEDALLDATRAAVRAHVVNGGFEDGSMPRHLGDPHEADGRTRHEPGWEGELPYAQFLGAWRSGAEEDHTTALRSAYHFTDVVIDHAIKLTRMHGYPPPSTAMPMNRLMGTVAAYLETGDPYLFEAAQAVTQTAHWANKNSWPRQAVGRDACYVRSAVLLYRYFADESFRRIALEGAQMVVTVQRKNGSFGDQGGGAGLHQWGGYITKPWIGLMALNGVLDYLELFPREKTLAQAVKKFADWLMSERLTHQGRDQRGWSYQHDFNGARRFYDFEKDDWLELPGKKTPWHHETLARLLVWCALRYGRQDYFAAWMESRRGMVFSYTDHTAAATLQFVPWVQARLWNATLAGDRVQWRPAYFGAATPAAGRILTPQGPQEAVWTRTRGRWRAQRKKANSS